jgi:hypothetical protein
LELTSVDDAPEHEVHLGAENDDLDLRLADRGEPKSSTRVDEEEFMSSLYQLGWSGVICENEGSQQIKGHKSS